MKNHLQSFIDQTTDLTKDPINLNALYHGHRATLQTNYPNYDDYFYDYWATRLTMLGSADEVTITIDNPNEPTNITITIIPEMGS